METREYCVDMDVTFSARHNASEHFNTSDKYFFYEEFNDYLISFSTSQELLEEVGEDTFVELLMN